MKHLSLKMLIFCILAPPLLYIITLTAAESFLQARYTKGIESSYLGDARMLLNGGMRIRDAVNRQVDQYVKHRAPLAWAVNREILISTKRGNLLYPFFFEEEEVLAPMSRDEIAAENFRLMNEKIVIKVVLAIDHNTLPANMLLGACIFLFAGILWFHYRAGYRLTRAEEIRKTIEMQALMKKADEYARKLEDLEEDRRKLHAAHERLNEDIQSGRRQADKNEEELLKEIIDLEEAMDVNRQDVETLQEENEALKGALRRHEKTRRRSKEAETVQKRFRTLYKHLIVNPRAVEGYIEFNDDMRIKCEEMIHQLNADPKTVAIKRKVFTKKTKETVLEVTFAYNGRLYFRYTRESRIEILAVGAKATQARDLAFIDSLTPEV